MRKINIIFSVLVLAMVLLSACAGNATPANPAATSAPATSPVETEVISTSTTSVEATSTSAASGTGAETTTPNATEGATAVVPVTGKSNALRLSEQLNSTVSNQNGEQAGTVDDMILDLDNAMVAYVIVDTGDKQVAVPWDQFNMATGQQPGNFVLQADADMFANAPTIDLSTLPAIGESAANWDSDLRSYWKSSNAGGAQPSTGSQSKLRGVMLASQVLAADLSVPGQSSLQANIEDLIVNAQSGKIQFVVVKTNFDNMERWIPVPLALFNWDTTNQAFNLDLNADLLRAALPVMEAQFPDINVQGWEQQWMTFWQNNGVNMTP